MPNHALTEANTLAARITELEEKIKGLKPEPVDPNIVKKEKELDEEYYRLDKLTQKAKDKAVEGTQKRQLDAQIKTQVFQATLEDLKNQKKNLRTLLSTALEAAK